jgi:hypothetical protein
MSKRRVVEVLDESDESGDEVAILAAPSASSGEAGKKRQRESTESVEIVERPSASSSSSAAARVAKAGKARNGAPAVPPGNSLRDIVRERQGSPRSAAGEMAAAAALRRQAPVAVPRTAVPRSWADDDEAEAGQDYVDADEDLGEHEADSDLALALELSRRDARGAAAPRAPRRPEPHMLPVLPGRGHHRAQAHANAHTLARAQSQSQQEADFARAVELSKASVATQVRKEQDEALQRSIEEDRRKAEAKRAEEQALAAAERAKEAAARTEERAKQAAKAAKGARAAALVRRREQLLAALPTEPTGASGVLLRFEAPGVKMQRAFCDTDRLRDVLAWMQVCDDKCLRAHVLAAVLPGPCEYLSDLPPHKQNEMLGQLGFHRCVVRQRIVEDGYASPEEEEEGDAAGGGGVLR